MVAILLVSYLIFLKVQKKPVVYAQSQFQENSLNLENFVFRDKDCSNVILGSSIAFRLKEADLGENFCNLSFAGESALTGLEILNNNFKGVKKVFIEVNVIKKIDEEMVGNTKGIKFFLKENVLFFQNRYQPVTLLINYLKGKNKSVPPSPSREQFTFWLNYNVKNQAEVSKEFADSVEKNLETLDSQISKLTEKGIEVVLIEIPMHEEILKSPKHQYLLSLIKQRFGGQALISGVPGANYTTDDGIHLSYGAASTYSKYLASLRF